MSSYFAHLIGNDHIKSYLLRMVEKNAIANSLLFAGPDGVGKSLFAQAFAKQLISLNDPDGAQGRKIESGNHPDIRIYRPEGKIGMHSIDSLRHFNEEVYQSPYQAKWKIFIIEDADRMMVYSANALLKTFEEPFKQSIIILLASSPESLLPTILSRCRTIRFHALSPDDIKLVAQQQWGKSPEEAARMASLARGSLGNAFRLSQQQGDVPRDLLLKLLSRGKFTSYSELIGKTKEISEYIDQRKQHIEDALRAELLKCYVNEPTSVQQQSIDKEVDGAVAMRLAQDASALFDVIFSWYRDMHLLLVNGNRAYLLNGDMLENNEQALQRGLLLPLEVVQKAIAQAKLSLERSTPFSSCLENLFLQLNFL